MKKILCMVMAVFALCSVSCNKADHPSGKENGKDKDPADAFVGEWSYTDDVRLKWGYEELEETNTGTFTLTKVNPYKVDVTGDFRSIGLVSGSMLNIASYSVNVEGLRGTYAFGPAYIENGVLSFDYSLYGRAVRDGLEWSYDRKGRITATKVAPSK